MRAELDAERMRVEAMPNGPEKEAALAALREKEEELKRIQAMPDGPEKDAALAHAQIEAERRRIESMPDGPEKEALLAALQENEVALREKEAALEDNRSIKTLSSMSDINENDTEEVK